MRVEEDVMKEGSEDGVRRGKEGEEQANQIDPPMERIGSSTILFTVSDGYQQLIENDVWSFNNDNNRCILCFSKQISKRS